MKLLIIEDEVDLLQSMTAYLEGAHYVVDSARNFQDATEKLDYFEYDCILLDIGLPGGSGLKLLKELKSHRSSDGVIIISARNSIDDKIDGLNLGADDYLAKPFHLPELAARIAAVLRRRQFEGSQQVRLENLNISLDSRTVQVDSMSLELTRKEFDLLVFLSSNKNRVVSKQAIASHLAGDEAEWYASEDIVYTHIKNLKKKLSEAGFSGTVKSMYGVGYKLISS